MKVNNLNSYKCIILVADFFICSLVYEYGNKSLIRETEIIYMFQLYDKTIFDIVYTYVKKKTVIYIKIKHGHSDLKRL